MTKERSRGSRQTNSTEPPGHLSVINVDHTLGYVSKSAARRLAEIITPFWVTARHIQIRRLTNWRQSSEGSLRPKAGCSTYVWSQTSKTELVQPMEKSNGDAIVLFTKLGAKATNNKTSNSAQKCLVKWHAWRKHPKLQNRSSNLAICFSAKPLLMQTVFFFFPSHPYQLKHFQPWRSSKFRFQIRQSDPEGNTAGGGGCWTRWPPEVPSYNFQ